MKLSCLTLLPIITFALALATEAAEKKVIIPSDLAPKPGAPAPMFSPGILVDGTLYVSGQMGTDLKTREIPANFDDEVRNALNTVGLILKQAGMDYQDVVSVTVYLSDMELFAKMNTIYASYFKEPRPARATVGISKLASPQGHIEISVTARK
jgi:2-iminobutanoate/2-iminopropanoate deaminase